MNKIIFLIAALLCTTYASAKGFSPMTLNDISFERHNDYMVLDMNIDLRDTDVESGRAQILTPVIVSEKGDSLILPSVAIYGRGRYIQYLRNGRHPLGQLSGNEIIKSSDRPQTLPYHASVRYENWMSNSSLVIQRSLYGCADCLIDENSDRIASHFEKNPMIPEIVYLQAKDTAPKILSLERESYVDFVVNKTDINPAYRKNPVELPRIRATIDTVYQDPDVTITGIWLKGYASPESPYSHNADLARGRTKALKDYVRNLYDFPESIMATDYEPEDWQGLKKMVSESRLEDKDAILVLIDSDMEPDAKEARMKKDFPKQYKYMLENFYPALRHTSYKVTYEVKEFDDIEKIRQVMHTTPGKLSLREFFLLGNSEVPGSDEFNEVYETAVRMFPDNPVANINAANVALQRQDFKRAEMYLNRAGDSPEAIYARGSLAYLTGDYDTAEALMRQVPMIKESQSTLDEIKKIRENKITHERSVTLR